LRVTATFYVVTFASGSGMTRRLTSRRYCQLQPGWARQVDSDASAVHGVTLPWQTDDVSCHEQPCCRVQVFCAVS
jgi:hypothetical protein